MSQLLRRMGKVPEAEEQESEISSRALSDVLKLLVLTSNFCCRDWLRFHKYGMPQSEFISLVTDPKHEGKDYIMEHPEMQKMCEGVVDLGNGMTTHFG